MYVVSTSNVWRNIMVLFVPGIVNPIVIVRSFLILGFEQNRYYLLTATTGYLQLSFLSCKLKFHSLFNNLQLPVKMSFLNEL